MSEGHDSQDPGQQRVSDAERHQVVEALQRAAGDGRLDVEELEERLESTWAARTYADLVPILLDLPYDAPSPGRSPAAPTPGSPTPRRSAGDATGPAAALAVEHDKSFVVLSEQKRTGVWRVDRTYTATAVLGSVVLDMREAVFATGEVTLTANAVLGSVEVVVDAETHVIIDGTPVLGEFSSIKDKVPAQLHEGSPVVRITGVAVLGSVAVVRKRRRDEPKQLWPRRR